MKEKEKKKWVKPELVVLVRRKAGEGVLQLCQGSGTGDSSEGTAEACAVQGPGQCYPCFF